jgi:hypothetical protein
MKRTRIMLPLVALTVVVLLVSAVPALAVGDVRVNVGSPTGPFPQNKQNEPAIAVNPVNPSVLVAGANDEVDLAPNVGGSAPFTPGVGVSGIYFSLDGGSSWMQPKYQGFSARTGTPGPGVIGTLPWYYESGLVSDGDPALAFGPKLGRNGRFDWGNGVRLYYANLTSDFAAGRAEQAFKGFEALAVSRFDGAYSVAGIADQGNWKPPVLVAGRRSSTTFSDKEAIWVDNAASSPYFGNAYVGWVSFRSIGGPPEPAMFTRSTDGGDTWSAPLQLSQAANNNSVNGRQGVTIRTDSKGTVYVFWEGVDAKTKGSVHYLARSTNGGRSFGKPFMVARVVDVGVFSPVFGDTFFDGIAGARTNSFPSVDIANGAPSGVGAPDTIVLAWPDARGGLNHEELLVQDSRDGGATWTAPVNAAEEGDRPNFPSVALSSDGADLYVTYNAFLDPYRSNLTDERRMLGVVRHAEASSLGTWSTSHRGVIGDARASSTNSLVSEFLGDYNYIAATNDFAAAVWIDLRNAAVDPGVLTYRAALAAGSPIAMPTSLLPKFGDSDIYSVVVVDPTP